MDATKGLKGKIIRVFTTGVLMDVTNLQARF